MSKGEVLHPGSLEEKKYQEIDEFILFMAAKLIGKIGPVDSLGDDEEFQLQARLTKRYEGTTKQVEVRKFAHTTVVSIWEEDKYYIFGQSHPPFSERPHFDSGKITPRLIYVEGKGRKDRRELHDIDALGPAKKTFKEI